MTNSTQKKHSQATYPDIVYTLEPLLQLAIYLLGILRWKQDLQRHSFLFVLSWTILCLHYYTFALTTPLWLILILYYYDTAIKAKNKQLTTHLNYERVSTELRDIQIELSRYLELDWFNRKRVLNNKIQIGALTLTIWMFFVNLFSLKNCIWFLGFLILSWKSPLFVLTRHACHRVIIMYQQQKQQPIGNELPYAPIASHSNNGHFCFTVVEHQRWYPFKGWSSNLLSKDRPEWSDIYHQPVPSIDSFKLPEPIAHTKNNTQISWKWITESWQAPTGWEYGSYDWQSWSKQHALHKLTRRRHWVRTASFSEEQRAVTAAIPMSRSNSLSTMTTSSSLSSESSLSSIDLIPSLSCHVQTKSIPTCMVFGKHHSEMLFTADAL